MARDLSRRGNDVTVIDINPLAFERLGTGLKINTVTGIGFDRNVLTEAGIESADSLAAVNGQRRSQRGGGAHCQDGVPCAACGGARV